MCSTGIYGREYSMRRTEGVYSMKNVVIVAASTGLPPDLKAGGLEVWGLAGSAGGDVEVSCAASGYIRERVLDEKERKESTLLDEKCRHCFCLYNRVFRNIYAGILVFFRLVAIRMLSRLARPMGQIGFQMRSQVRQPACQPGAWTLLRGECYLLFSVS